jgi:hypothetical protein
MSKPVMKTNVKIREIEYTPGEPAGKIIINNATSKEKQANIPCIIRKPLKVNSFFHYPITITTTH